MTSAALRVGMCVLLLGCGQVAVRLAAGSTADVFAEASPAIDQHWDAELVGGALPHSLVTLEGLLRIVPEDGPTLLGAARGYVGYAFGVAEERAEVHALAGRREAAAYERRRAVALYRRARDLAMARVRLDADDFDEARALPVAEYRAWLDDEFDDADDAPLLFWLAYAWGSWVNAASPAGPHPDRAYAIATMRRSVHLDPHHLGGSGAIFLAYVATRAPGSTVEGAERAWARALELGERKNLLAQLLMARLYATRIGDRALYVSLLREILEAGDVSRELRLTNAIARRRAERDLRQVDARFATP